MSTDRQLKLENWLDLEARFRAMQDETHGLWLSHQWGGPYDQFNFSGLNRDAKAPFCDLARLGARWLRQALNPENEIEKQIIDEPDDLRRWLNAMKTLPDGNVFETHHPVYETHDDGEKIIFFTGSFKGNLAQISADLCLKLQVERPIPVNKNYFKIVYENHGIQIVNALLIAGLLWLAGHLYSIYAQ